MSGALLGAYGAMWYNPGGWGDHYYINGLVWFPHTCPNQGRSQWLYGWQDLGFTFNSRRNKDILQAFGVKQAKERRNIGRRQQLVEFVFDGGLDVKIMRISIKVVILLAPQLYR